MNRKPVWMWVLAFGATTVTGSLLWVSTGHEGEPSSGSAVAKGSPSSRTLGITSPQAPASVTASKPQPATATSKPDSQLLLKHIQDLVSLLRTGTPEQNAARLEELRLLLRTKNPQGAVLAVRLFLQSGKDSDTGLPYTVGEDGTLASAPTLRVYLLDELANLAEKGNDTNALLEESYRVLGARGSADEWSVALRNIAWGDKDSNTYLNQKFQEMVSNPIWAKDPSAGMLEAFDIPAYTGDTGSITILVAYLDAKDPDTGERSTLANASNVALDKMAQNSPGKVMDYLNSNPSILASKPLLRADYFAKADLNNPNQRREIEDYFSRKDVTEQEKNKAIYGLAVPGGFASDGLLISGSKADGEARLNALESAAKGWANKFPSQSKAANDVIQKVRQ